MVTCNLVSFYQPINSEYFLLTLPILHERIILEHFVLSRIGEECTFLRTCYHDETKYTEASHAVGRQAPLFIYH